MKKKMGIEGVGPKIAVLGGIYIAGAYLLDHFSHESFLIVNNSDSARILFWIFLMIGLLMWLSSVALLLINFPKGKLITGGFFAAVPNPLYDAFILFLIPALSLYLNSWIYLGASIVFYAAMKTMGKAEDQYLSETFGKEYEDYKKKVWFKFL